MLKSNTIIGTILILLGLIWFADNLNIIDFEIGFLITSIIDLWPLILVVIGINLISKDSRIQRLTWIGFIIVVIAYAIYIQYNGPILPYSMEIENFLPKQIF